MTGRDPIEEFFARERAKITREPADEERWQAIVTAGRRGSRSRWLAYAAAAAAAVAIGTVGYAIGRNVPGAPDSSPAGRGSVTALSTRPSGSTTSRSPSAIASGSGSATPGDRGTTAPPPPSNPATDPPAADMAMPATFKAISMSQAGGQTIFALGEGVCTDRPCAVIARSRDNGRSWRRTATLTDGAISTGAGAVGEDGGYRQIRMADEQIGWVFGPRIQQTTDGGVTWHDYTVAGKSVVDLASDGTDVAIVSTSGTCDGKQCDGEVLTQVVPKELRAATVTPVVSKTSAVTDASVALWKARAYVSLEPVNGAQQPFAVGADGKTAALDIACGETARARIVAPADGGTLFAVCAEAAAAGIASYLVHRSHDEGASWEAVSDKPLELADAGAVSFAAGDDEHLVAASGGSPDIPGSLVVSADAGRTWQAVGDPALPKRGWRWVGAPGARWFYLLPTDGEKAYWWGQNFGATWSKVPMD